MKTKTYITNSITLALLLLWIPVAIDKFINFDAFQSSMLQQPFGDTFAWVLIYTLPILEITTAVLLVFDRSRRLGMLLSSVLMIAFTGYVGLALLGTWGKLPCACGLIISGMSWMQHLWFNLLFMIISITGYILSTKWNKEQLKQDCKTDAEDELLNTTTPT